MKAVNILGKGRDFLEKRVETELIEFYDSMIEEGFRPETIKDYFDRAFEIFRKPDINNRKRKKEIEALQNEYFGRIDNPPLKLVKTKV